MTQIKMPENFKPMLAKKLDFAKLKFPVYCSAKLDGIRAISNNGQLLSRSLKHIPNRFIQSHTFPHGLDGELVVGKPTDPDCYRNTVSGVMSHDGEPNFTFYYFDDFSCPALPYGYRLACLDKVVYRPHHRLHLSYYALNRADVEFFEKTAIEQGYEGAIIRQQNSLYKFGRSTTKEGALLKLKRFHDSEAKIIDIIELQHNDNPAFENELGYTAHSTFQENKVDAGTMGALIVVDLKTGVQFKIGIGFDTDERLHFWQNQSLMIGEIVKYKYFPVGIKDKPRHPVFVGFRSKEDLS